MFHTTVVVSLGLNPNWTRFLNTVDFPVQPEGENQLENWVYIHFSVNLESILCIIKEQSNDIQDIKAIKSISNFLFHRVSWGEGFYCCKN